jgi:plastocyanin
MARRSLWMLSLLATLGVILPLLGCSANSADRRSTAAGTAASGSDADRKDAPGTSTNPSSVEVVIDNFTFSPATLTVAAGTKVTWVNRDDVPHTATSTATPRVFDSRTLDTDGRFSFVFSTPGTYEYFCAVHPKMTGKVIVK